MVTLGLEGESSLEVHAEEEEEETEPGVHVYEGEWVNGRLTGKAKVTSPDGTVHEGYFKRGLRHGPGNFSPLQSHVLPLYLLLASLRLTSLLIILHTTTTHSVSLRPDSLLTGKVVSAEGEIFEGEWEEDELVG